MAAHSSILACKTPRTEEPGRLQSTGLQRVRHDSPGPHARWIKSQRQKFWVKQKEPHCFSTQMGPQWAKALKTMCPILEGIVSSLIVFKEQGVNLSWTCFLLVSCELIGSEHHQPSGSNQSGAYVLVGSIQLTSFTWWGSGIFKTAQRMWSRILSIVLEEKVKILDFV